jgi:hypothetical protein
MKLRRLAAFTAAAVLAGGYAATAAAGVAEAVTQPSVSYQVSGCNGFPCGFHVTISSNPSNVEVRAWEWCPISSSFIYGGWHNSVGATSNTANCGGAITSAGFQYRKSNPLSATCWTTGHSWNGFC